MTSEELAAALQRVSDGVTAELSSAADSVETSSLMLVDEAQGDALWHAMETAAKRPMTAERARSALQLFVTALRESRKKRNVDDSEVAAWIS